MVENITLMERVKTCTHCGVEKPPSEFNKHQITSDGLDHQCRTCSGIRSKAFRQTPSGIYTSLKGRATYRRKRKDYHEVTITRDEFVEWYNSQVKECAYCDIPEEHLELMKTDFDGRINRLEIDCVDNSAGYKVGNLVLSCHRCNFVKLNFFSFDEMREIAQKYFKPKWVSRLTGSANK